MAACDVIPALRPPAIYELLAQLRSEHHPEPIVTALGLWLCREAPG